ncbi:hypothetical protein DFR30_2011 [Thiogranum longum]|uniref:Uncharacterized protein n=1 Tax=Thiogranum longum TaxID=1537524 RepID=A0A4R1H9Y3_9GAMM|nr:hypothetical protein [Thiogranum longum]TCK18727.1 hypothetical protein DFR30_2011 [Thiogranum longum]
MDVVEVLFFVILELAVLLGIAVFVLDRKRRQLQAQVQELTREESAPESDVFESITSGYLPYLEKLILESRAQLEAAGDGGTGTETETETETAEDETTLAIRYRLSLLESEKKVTERCNDYPEKRWEHVTELFTPPSAPVPEDDDPELEEAESNNPLLKAQEQIKRLESFRDKFFSMKKQLRELEASRQKLTEQLEILMPEAERSEELRALLDTMNGQRDRLQAELDQLESQSDELAKTATQNTPVQEQENESSSALTKQIDKQNRKISELHHLVDDLNLEAEKAEELQSRFKQFELASRDMNMCIQVLEEENQFLQEQIKSLLELDENEPVYHSGASADAENPDQKAQLEALQSELEGKDQQIKSLEEKYASMEQEYLTLYEEANS